ncbi:MAG: aspartate carbamoyltransferase [Nitrospirota bacterium]
MDYKGQHILSTKQFDKDGLLELFEETKKMETEGGDLSGKLMATLFYEPSTRTRFSFEAAMNRLGGRVISNADMISTSSHKKRETLEDTGKVVSKMVDVIVMRHPEVGSVAKLASKSEVPVINAGDGASQHPTQGLLDIYTVWKERGTLDGLIWGMVGDLKNSRVFHSQADLLRHFDVKFVLVSPEGLEMPTDYINGEYRESKELASVIGEMDVISSNRIQEERFGSPEDAEKYKGAFVIDEVMMRGVKEDAILLNPLPRVDEITVGVDLDPRAKYFDQVENGVYVRMALLKKVLE